MMLQLEEISKDGISEEKDYLFLVGMPEQKHWVVGTVIYPEFSNEPIIAYDLGSCTLEYVHRIFLLP